MVKLFSLLRKRSDLSDGQFVAHWRNVHGELAKDIERLQRYIQNRRVDDPDLGLGEGAFEGIAEVWFEDVRAAVGMGEDPAYLRGCRQDEPNFLEVDDMGFVVTEEEQLVPGPPVVKDSPGVKLMLLLRREPGLAPAAFAERWVERARMRESGLGIIREVWNPALPSELTDPMWWPDADRPADDVPYDGIHELWWPDSQRLSEARSNPGWNAIIADGCVDRGQSCALIVEEHRVIWPSSLSKEEVIA
jgi:hypothetical protein